MSRSSRYPSAPRIPDERASGLRRRLGPRARRALLAGFLTLVGVLLVVLARDLDWAEVGAALARLSPGMLAAAALLTAASHGLYAHYDLLGRHYTGHALAHARVVAVTFVSYAFNLNLGALVGGVAFRLRLYSRLGLAPGTIARVLSLSLATNWLGYLLLAGSLFALRPLALPPSWRIDAAGLRWLGAAMVAAALGYLWMCAFARQRDWAWRGHAFHLPSARTAALQLTLSTLNWALIGGVLYVLFGQRIDYPSVLSVLCIAAVAGVLAHVPAGLGVLEAVFASLLSHRVPAAEVVGVLLAYRALYYLAPLVLALGVYARIEQLARREARQQT